MIPNQLFNAYLQEKLDTRIAGGFYRTLVHATNKIDFSSNDYFGFSTLLLNTRLYDNQQSAGATGSRSITGNSLLAEDTEKIIAAFHNAEAALIFNCGYMANVGLFSCIATKGDTFISDEYIHASIIDGMRLSHANRVKFKHNDLNDLEKKLQQIAGKKIVAIESIYSMDGDEAPLKAIAALCKKYTAILIVDEAHATGVFGNKGEGLVGKYNLMQDVFACTYTFGKAIGLHGAVVVGSHTLRHYLINNARAFIYTTALPPQIYLQLQAAYATLPAADRNKLYALIAYFKELAQTLQPLNFINSNSAIQGIIIGDNFKAKALAEILFAKGFYVRPILSPTVPVGTERIRICLHVFNTFDEINALMQAIKQHLI